MLSPDAAVKWWEIWIYAHPDHREPVQECGRFQSERDAVMMGSRLRMWLHTGVISEALFTNCHDAQDNDALLLLGESLRRRGIDPTRTLITARPCATGTHDNAESAKPKGWTWRNTDPDDDDQDDDDSMPVLVPDGAELVAS